MDCGRLESFEILQCLFVPEATAIEFVERAAFGSGVERLESE